MDVIRGILMTGGLGHDSNIYVIDGEIVVDTGTGDFFPQAKSEISRAGITNPKLIVNTHAHYDHTGGNKKFRDWLKSDIAIHSRDREALESGAGTLSILFKARARTTTVDRVLKEGSKIKTENFSFEIISTPGHTPGSICLYDKDKRVLISGDTLFAEGIGRTDLPGGSQEELLNSLKKLVPLKIDYLLSGHGRPKTTGINFYIKRTIAAMEREQAITDDTI